MIDPLEPRLRALEEQVTLAGNMLASVTTRLEDLEQAISLIRQGFATHDAVITQVEAKADEALRAAHEVPRS